MRPARRRWPLPGTFRRTFSRPNKSAFLRASGCASDEKRRSRKAGISSRSSARARASSSRATPPAAFTRSSTSAGIAARGSASVASGHFQGSIQCPYHAWTYGLDGTLKVARNMAEVPGFDRAEYPLKEAAVALWEGFIFVNLERASTFEGAFAPLIGRFTRWNIGGLRNGAQPNVRACLQLEARLSQLLRMLSLPARASAAR